MAPRLRFDEFLKAELSTLSRRCLAEHEKEVARLEHLVRSLEDDNEYLRKQRPARSLSVSPSLHAVGPRRTLPARPAKTSRTTTTWQRSRSDLATTESSAEPCGRAVAASPQLVQVIPPLGTASLMDVEEADMESCFANIVPSSFAPVRSCSRNGHHQSIEAALDEASDGQDGSNGLHGSLAFGSSGRGRTTPSENRNAQRLVAVSPRPSPSASPRPSWASCSTGGGRSFSSDDVIRLEARAEQEEEVAQKESRRSSYESLNSMGSADGGDMDFEVLPEWRSSRSIHSKRRTIADLTATSSHGAEHDAQPLLRTPWHPSFMILPGSSLNACWLCAGLACLCWDLIAIPLIFLNSEEGSFMLTMSWMVRLYWTLDLVKSFFTGRLQADGGVDTRFDHVAMQYAFSWLPLDFLCIAIDWSILLVSGGMRFLRVVCLLRLMKVNKVEALISQYTCSETVVLLVGLVKLIVALLASAHFIACTWYRIGMGSWEDERPSEAGWVAHHELQDAPLQDRYAWSLHWSLAQFMGEIIFEPCNSTERGFAIFALVVAFFTSAFFVSGITTSMTRLLLVAGSQASQLQALSRYLFSLRISSSLTARLQRNAQHILAEQKRNAPHILSLISEPLKVELYYELHSPVILAHPFFKGYDQLHPASVRRVCHTAVTSVLLSRGDVVFSDFEAPANPRMYFVQGSGGLRYRQLQHPVQFIEHGDWICEPVLWTHWVHCGSLAASHDCEILALGAGAFQSVANLFPTKHLCKYAMAFIQQLNMVDKAGLSDLWRPDFGKILRSAMPIPFSPQMHHHHRRLSLNLMGPPSPGGSSAHSFSGTLRTLFKSARPEAKQQPPARAWN